MASETQRSWVRGWAKTVASGNTAKGSSSFTASRNAWELRTVVMPHWRVLVAHRKPQRMSACGSDEGAVQGLQVLLAMVPCIAGEFLHGLSNLGGGGGWGERLAIAYADGTPQAPPPRPERPTRCEAEAAAP